MVNDKVKSKVIGINIDVNSTTIAVVDLRGTILAQDVISTKDYPNVNNFIEVLSERVIALAESNGGGGCSQSDLPWRDRDEEDAAYMRRCMFCAQKMMKPKGGYKVKKGGGLSLH